MAQCIVGKSKLLKMINKHRAAKFAAQEVLNEIVFT